MSGIEIYDTEVFTGRIEGPQVHQLEFEFTQIRNNGERITVRRQLNLSDASKFMVPLPGEIGPDGNILVSLKEIGTGRNIFAADVSLGTVFYHNFGTTSASPQLKLERGTYGTLIHSVSVSETHFVPLMFFVLVVVVAVVFSALWSLLCTNQVGPTQKPSHRKSSPQKNPPQRTDSVSTLTETDNETADAHSLAPRGGENAQHKHPHHIPSSTAAMRVGTNTRKTRRVRKAVFNPYDDDIVPDDGRWDPWFNPSGW